MTLPVDRSFTWLSVPLLGLNPYLIYNMTSSRFRIGQTIPDKWAKAKLVNYEDNGWENFLNFERKEVLVLGPNRLAVVTSDASAVSHGDRHFHTLEGESHRPERGLGGNEATGYNSGKMLFH
jgi:hypothetical protein